LIPYNIDTTMNLAIDILVTRFNIQVYVSG